MKRVMIAASLAACVVFEGAALCHNLLHPWGDPPRCSPPQTPLFAFYNHQNTSMLFNEGQEIEIWCQAGVRTAGGLAYSLHFNQVSEPIHTGEAKEHLANLFSIKIPTGTLKPGFYDLRVKLDCGWKTIHLFSEKKAVPPVGVCTFGWKVDDMAIADTMPKDFKAFWAEAVDAYRRIPLDLRVEGGRKVFRGKEIDAYNLASACLPGNFDPHGARYDEVVSYKVSWAGPDGGRVYAWLARPNVDGVKFPALLVLPGAGTGGRPRPLDHARHGYLAIDVQVHGFDVEVEGRPDVPGYNGVPPLQYDDPKKFCWYNIYLRAMRGVEALAAMPEVDAGRIVTVGGSQGGRLSYVVSALDGRVAATIPCIAHGANIPHLVWTKRKNVQTFGAEDAGTLKGRTRTNGVGDVIAVEDTPAMKCEAYFDPMNFSPFVSCPIFANAGLIDPVSPAYSTWAVFKRAGSKNKTFNAVAGHGHDWFAAFDRLAYAWLDKTLVCEDRDFVPYVDPLIGSIGEGNTFPGACYPFGMVQPSPDSGTRTSCPGYRYTDETIRGFSQTHLNGTGTPHLGDILLQPFVGSTAGRNVFTSAYDKASQACSPDYYRVTLKDFDVQVEATASERVSWYRFTYNGNQPKRLLVDSASALLMPWKQKDGPWIPESTIEFSEDRREIAGSRRVKGWVDSTVYYVVRFDRPYTVREMLPRNAFEGAGDRCVVDFTLDAGEPLGVQVALSNVSVAGARRNLAAETAGRTFDGVRRACRRAWNDIFARAEIVKGTDAQKRSFYTSLYHLCIQPNNIADVDGQYRGADGKVARAKGGRYYSTLSLWDTFRAAHPLYTILTPERVDGFVDTMVAQGEVFGVLPIWSIWGKEGWSMIGVHSIPVIVDAWCKGFRNFDGEQALGLMVKSLTTPRPDFPKLGWNILWEHGYLPYDKGKHDTDFVEGQSVSRTLEIAYNWWCVEKFARLLGNEATARMANRWANSWKNLFDRQVGFMRAKSATGKWREPFNPTHDRQGDAVWGDYTEASAWVYLWHVFQDAEGLTELLGGPEATVRKLDEFFRLEYGADSATQYWGRKSGTIGMYWHGNEPSHHIPYFYTLLGRREKCEELVRKVCENFYLDKPDGLCGNDDCGQMSAWYVFSMFGFYPFNPAGEDYVLGAGQLGEVVLKLPEGRRLRIVSKVKDGGRVSRIVFNGKAVTAPKLAHDALMKGGCLVFE